MKKIQHTNGPWFGAKYRIFANQFALAEYPIHAPKRGLIAKAYREVDAKLISAAPELLQALEDMLAQGSGMPKSCGHNFDCVCITDNARAIVAKAKGEKLPASSSGSFTEEFDAAIYAAIAKQKEVN